MSIRKLVWCGFVAACLLGSSLGAETHGAKEQKHTLKVVYIVPSSHWDLGFKLPPEEQLDDIKPHLDEVIRTAQKDPEFRWVIESAWQLRAWLDRTKDPALVQELVRLIRKGQIQLSAVYGSEHTEFMGAEQMNRLVYEMQGVEDELGVSTDLAMMDDVPGFTLRLPQVLARSGIKYFVTGSNLFIGGGTSLHPGKMPFHWRSPDGSSVLTWQTGSKNGGYVEAMGDYFLDPSAHYFNAPADAHFYPKEWMGLPPLEIMQRGMDKLVAEYEKADYPYEAAMVLYVHDFIPASYEEDGLLPAVRAWNAAGKEPRLVVATPAEFFHDLEARYGDPFPTYSGDFSGLWSEVKTNSPGISADARWVQDYQPQAEALWSLLSFRAGTHYPQAQLEDAETKLLKYDEHSGAGQPGWPKMMTLAEVNKQNQEYSEYTRTARSTLRNLMAVGVQALTSVDTDADATPRFVVYNPLSWPRSEFVRLRPPAAELMQVRDLATGQLMKTEIEADGQVGFVAEDIPSMGYRTYRLERAVTALEKCAPAAGVTLDNKYYTLRVRLSDGAITSLFDKQLGRELVNAAGPRRLGQMVRWNFHNYLPDPEWNTAIQHIRGPLSDELVITRKGSWWPVTRIALESGAKQVIVDNVYDRSKMAQVPIEAGSEFYSFEFPLQFGSQAKIMVDDGIGFHNLPKDYLPGAKTDAAVPTHTLSLVDTDDVPSSSVSLLQREAFYDIPIRWPGQNGEIGPFLNEIRMNVLRKADQGDMKDAGVVTLPTVEPGYGPLYTASFAIASGRSFDPVEAWRQGWEFNVPLLVSMLPQNHKPRSQEASYFAVTAPNVAILAFKPARDGNPDHYMMRLQEIAGRSSTFALRSLLQIAEVAEISMTEDRVVQSALEGGQLKIGAHQTLTLRLTLPHAANNWQPQPTH
jgi:hypothetical protein